MASDATLQRHPCPYLGGDVFSRGAGAVRARYIEAMEYVPSFELKGTLALDNEILPKHQIKSDNMSQKNSLN